MRKTSTYEMDMCSGALMGKIVRFTIPLMLTSLLQLLFNAADVVVVGKFAGKEALAAVGSTGAIINLIINVLMGLSLGTSVLTARYYGANSPKDVSEVVHTSIAVSLFGGIGVGIVGFLISRWTLTLMGSPADVIDGAALYMRIYFCGLPVIAVYNFGSAVLRAVGDTKRPLYFLLIAGVVNVVLNLFTVIVLDMGVAGVALATVVSQAVSAALVIMCLIRSETCIHFDVKRMRISMSRLVEIMRIGIPAGIQGSVFSISNVIIQSAINEFGSVVIAANSAASSLEGFVYVIMNAVYTAALTFTSQNIGAGRFERVKKILWRCMGLVALLGIVAGVSVSLFGRPLLAIYSNESEVIEIGRTRLWLVCAPYFLCGMMEVMVGMMRGMGYSLTPMIVAMVGVCGFRLGWIFTVFASHRTLETLYASYPISWLFTMLVHGLCFIFAYRKTARKLAAAAIENQ